MRTRVIIRYVGISLVLVAMMMAVSGMVALMSGPDDSTMQLFFAACVTFLTGVYPMIFVRSESNVSTKEGISIVVLSWLASCLFGIIPYMAYGSEFTFMDAFFESVSGFTTTGASILTDIEALPAGLLFWRASTAWVGGLGIVSIFSLVIPHSLDRTSVLSRAELSDMTKSQSSRHGKSFVGAMLTVYVVLTVTCAVLLGMTGMPWLDAVTNAMSACSTCGFCVRNASIGAYDSLTVELLLIMFMVVSGVSFVRIFNTFARSLGRSRRLSGVTTSYIAFLVIATLVITLNLMNHGDISFLKSLRLAAFQVCSITTTTGFATTDTSVWPALSILVLVLASVVCACSGSTSGGMKMDRVLLLISYMGQSLRKGINPRRVVNTRFDGRVVPEELAAETMRFILLYVVLLAVGAFVNTAFGLDLETALSASVACLGNVGPGFGDVGSVGNYADFPAILKFNASMLMIAGRLEIIPLATFIGIMWR